MKIEQKQLLGFLGRLSVLIVFCCLYAIGGSGEFWGGQLWIRRWFATSLLCIWGFIISRDWRSLVFYPLMAGSLTLPYGADILWQKIALRSLCGAAYGISFNGYNFITGKISLAVFGVILAIVGSILFGAFNPFPNAMIEQGMIGLCASLMYIFSVRRREEL